MYRKKYMKKVEQIVAEKYPFDSRKAQSNDDWKVIDATNRAATLQRLGFIAGYTTAKQSQPMWREIEPTLYYPTHYMRNKESAILRSGSGWELLRDGYTHYLSSEDLLKLPVESKPLQVTVEDGSELLPNPFKIGDKVELISFT